MRAVVAIVLEHCHGVQAMLDHGETASLACETDLLRQRASALEMLAVATNRL